MIPTKDHPGEYGHYVGMSVEERKVADQGKRDATEGPPFTDETGSDGASSAVGETESSPA